MGESRIHREGLKNRKSHYPILFRRVLDDVGDDCKPKVSTGPLNAQWAEAESFERYLKTLRNLFSNDIVASRQYREVLRTPMVEPESIEVSRTPKRFDTFSNWRHSKARAFRDLLILLYCNHHEAPQKS